MAGIRFRLATATTKSNTRSRRPSTRSSRGFYRLPAAAWLFLLWQARETGRDVEGCMGEINPRLGGAAATWPLA